MPQAGVRIVPWPAGELELLTSIAGVEAMMIHLGGPETPQQIAERQARYEKPGSGALKIIDAATGEGLGFVGYWDQTWRGEEVYEVGWSVAVAFQGRGVAGQAAAQVVELARADGRHRYVHAFPAVTNGPSNGVCRKLGFTLLGPCEREYPRDSGQFAACNDWRLEL